ncbi:hypothetical protein AB0F30_17220 [Streptomyces sp. NPDC029006]|uniref:hypothetical protein n=1 Tax=Streptomyces sp. NPDC029006 TaxID=3155467 RepID=UPI0033FAD1E7
MARGDTTDNAAERLHELGAFLRTYPVTGAAGHSYISSAPRSAGSSALPYNPDAEDRIRACMQEIADHTLAVNPDAGPLPEHLAAYYEWMWENTRHAPEQDQFRAEVIEYRQWLENCLAARDHETVRKQVRKQACPECGCWGLMWLPARRRAICTNRKCVDRDGVSTTLSLARLAHAVVTTRKKSRQARAT